MGHNCTDWTTTPPSRKTPLLILRYGESHLYATVPGTFTVSLAIPALVVSLMVVTLQALEELARKKFGLGTSDIEFYSACMNLCNEVPARIDDDVWEHVTPYIGCIMVAQKTGTKHTDGTVCIYTLLVLTFMLSISSNVWWNSDNRR